MFKRVLYCLVVPLMMVACQQNLDRSDNSHEDGGSTPPAPDGASLPFLTKANELLYLSWVETSGDTTALHYSSFNGTDWTAARKIAQGTDWFVNWADYPMISVNDEGQKLAYFPAKSAKETYAYDVHLTMAANGISWSEDGIIHRDGTATEHGFVTMLPYRGNMLVTWLDGRNTGPMDHNSATGHGAMTIRLAVVGFDRITAAEYELDDRVCDCCQTSGAITANGPVVVYRDRSPEEVRDMSIVRFVDGSWTEPATVYEDNWEIAGCPVNGPRAAAQGNTLAIAWFTAPQEQPEVKLIFSMDGGASFEKPILLDNTSPIGRVDAVMVDSTSAVVSWVDQRQDLAEIRAAWVKNDGTIKTNYLVGITSPSRKSGFPQMEMIKDKLYFAWTAVDSSSSHIEFRQINLNDE